MDSIASILYKTVDPKDKNAKWINDMITQIRRDWRQLIDSDRIEKNKRLLFSQQDMGKIKKAFKDKNFLKHTEFIPLGIWPRIINILVEEIIKNSPKAEVKATDPTAISDKKKDILLLNTKHIYERNVNEQNVKIGMPAERIGKDNFKGNIDEFDRLRLDPNDPDDIDFYEQSGFQRLKYEISAQLLLNNFFKINKFDEELIRDAVIDILSSLSFNTQTYVDEMTGEIKCNRVYPEEVYGIFGDKRDGADDIAKGYITNLTVREWLGRVGNEFEFNRDWRQLLWALNYTNNRKYTGFINNGVNYTCLGNEEWMREMGLDSYQNDGMLNFNLAYTYNVYCGYVEFSSIDATATYLAKIESGEILPIPVSMDYFLEDKKESKEYYKESYYNEQIYKSYFLPTSTTSQYIYNWGKVYYQQLYGANDEYAKGTLNCYRMEGVPAAEISEFYIEFANLAAYRMKWAVYHAKPQKEQYVIEELTKVAKHLQRLYPQSAKGKTPAVDNILHDLIQYKRENFIDLRSYPEIEGKTYPVLAPPIADRGGIDPIAIGLQAVEQWCEMQIAEKVGLNDIRLGQQQNDRQSVQLGNRETQSSLNSTSYIYRIIQYSKQNIATTVLNYAQDIVKFEDSIPYKWLNKLMGENEFENLKLLKDFAPHRYGIFVEDYNVQFDRQRVIAAADRSLDSGDGRGGITLTEWSIVTTSDDPKMALKLLAFYKYKAEKKKRKQELETMKIQQQNAMEQKAADAKTEQMKGQLALQKSTIEAQGFIKAAEIGAQAKIQVKEISNEHEPLKQESKANAQKDVEREKSNLENQKPLS